MASAEKDTKKKGKEEEEDVELKLDLGDIELGELLGDGSFSQVFVGTPKKRIQKSHAIHQCGNKFACKIMLLRSINVNRNKQKIVGSIMREKRALYHCRRLKIPFIMQLYATAKNSEKIAFISEYLPNGDLLDSLTKFGGFSYEACQYYMSCIVCVMNELHKIGIIHRDLKPENIMLNSKYQPILCDFGCVKIIPSIYNSYVNSSIENDEKKSKFQRKIYEKEDKSCDPDFVGTPEFMGPELLKTGNNDNDQDNDSDSDSDNDNENDNEPSDKNESEKKQNNEKNEKNEKNKDDRMKSEYYKCLDFWSLGCLLYQLNTAKLLFHAPSEWLVYQKIIKMDFEYPKDMNPTIKDLIEKLLIKEPMKRLGSKDINDLKNHKFFQGIEWEKIESIKPPYLNAKHKAQMQKQTESAAN